MKNLNSDHLSDNIDINEQFQLILFNDDINTIDYVIETLAEICGFEEIQSEQIALLTHFKGKQIIKTGNQTYILELKESLENAGLTVSAQKY